MGADKLHVIILGAGKIGLAVSHMLASSGRYTVTLCDATVESGLPAWIKDYPIQFKQCDIVDTPTLANDQRRVSAVLSCLPFHLSSTAAELAAFIGAPYFDLTESIEQTQAVSAIALKAGIPAVSQCGLAPGFVNIAAFDILADYDHVQDLNLRVGALPRHPSNRLKYNLTWSTAGLINQYTHECEILRDGQRGTAQPLGACRA